MMCDRSISGILAFLKKSSLEAMIALEYDFNMSMDSFNVETIEALDSESEPGASMT